MAVRGRAWWACERAGSVAVPVGCDPCCCWRCAVPVHGRGVAGARGLDAWTVVGLSEGALPLAVARARRARRAATARDADGRRRRPRSDPWARKPRERETGDAQATQTKPRADRRPRAATANSNRQHALFAVGNTRIRHGALRGETRSYTQYGFQLPCCLFTFRQVPR